MLSLLTSISLASENIETSIQSSYHYDSNLFRLADEDEAKLKLGDSDMSDRFLQLAAAIKANLPISRQLLSFNAEIQDVRFDRFDYLNYTGGNAQANWNWQYSKYLNGEILLDYERIQSNFEDFQFVEGDIQTKQGGKFSVQHNANPDLHGKVTFSWRDIDHSASRQKVSNRQVRTVQTEFRFFTRARTYFGIRFGFTSVSFPDRVVTETSTTDDGFSDTSLNMTLRINTSHKTTLEGWGGFTLRTYDNLTKNNTYGFTGNFKHTWRVTDKFELVSSIWRDFDPVSDGFNNQLIKMGIKVEPQWMITTKIMFMITAQHEVRNYDNTDENTTGSREDDTTRLLASVNYLFNRNLQWGVALQTEKRSSSNKQWRYKNKYAMTSLKFMF